MEDQVFLDYIAKSIKEGLTNGPGWSLEIDWVSVNEEQKYNEDD